ncbi:hypothetical protein INR49_030921 [Caranx melampygus]|nr:hypothetical protein INR49_030921 [Caranx melampygus]
MLPRPLASRIGMRLTGVEDLLDDCSHLSLQHGVEQLDNEDQAGAEHQQRESQQDQTHKQVRMESGIVMPHSHPEDTMLTTMEEEVDEL